jgi:hypothetical protein
MIRRIAFAVATLAFGAGAALAQPYGGEPDPYSLPPGYDQVTGYGDATAEADAAEDYGYQYGDDYGTTPPDLRDDAVPYADERGDVRARDDSHYNSGASVRGSSTYSREGYSRSGSTYSSRESASSQEAYVEGTIDQDGRVRERAYVGAPVYADRSGYAASSSSSAYASSSSAARFGYQRRFEAFSVATEQSETTSYARREEYAYLRREPHWNAWDIRLDSSFQSSLTGGVEGDSPVMWSSGGGYATASASASAYAGARAFAGVRAGRGRGHRGHGGCGCH